MYGTRMSNRLTPDQLRKRLPLERYLHLANEAIFTGRMPTYDRRTGEQREEDFDTVLTAQQRLDLIKYLTDKAMPNAARLQSVTITNQSKSRIQDIEAEQVSQMSLQDLETMLIEDATHDPETEESSFSRYTD